MDKTIDSSAAAFTYARKIIPALMLAMLWGCTKTEDKPVPPVAPPQAAAPTPAPQMAAEAPKTLEAVQPKPAAPVAAETRPAEAKPAETKPVAAAPAPSGTTADGEQAYKSGCLVCHKAGIAGAPRTGDKADWAPRIKQGKDVLYKHTLEGFKGPKGMMPPRGGSALKDDQLKAAVDYMIGQSQ